MDEYGKGIVKNTYDFLKNPRGFMLDFIADTNIFAKIIVEAADFSNDFYRLLLKELNNSRILSELTVIDPQERTHRKIIFEDYLAIENCLSNNFPPNDGIEYVSLDAIGACMCYIGYSNQKSQPTRELVKRLPGKVGKSFAKATWNRIVNGAFFMTKNVLVKKVKHRLPNKLKNKFMRNSIDDMYRIIIDELANTVKKTYVNKAKF